MKTSLLVLTFALIAAFSYSTPAQLCSKFGVTLNVHDNDLKPVKDHTIRIVPWLKDELKGKKFGPVADKPGTSAIELFEGHVITGNYKIFVSAPGFIETEKSINFPHCTDLTYDILLLRKKEKYRIVNGHVGDDKGNAVKYLALTFTNYADQAARTVSTDFNGNFELKLKPGEYKITFKSNYYGPLRTQKFKVREDGEETFNLGLRAKE